MPFNENIYAVFSQTPRLAQFSPEVSHKYLSAQPGIWMCVSLCVYIHWLLGDPARRQLCYALVSNITESLSLILSSTISLTWAVSYVGLIDGCPFPETLLHPYPCLFCRQDKLWVDFCLFVCLGWCPIPPWKSCLPTGVGHFIFHIPSLSESQQVSPTLTPQDLFYPTSPGIPRDNPSCRLQFLLSDFSCTTCPYTCPHPLSLLPPSSLPTYISSEYLVSTF